MLRLSKNRVGRVRPGGVEAGPVAALVVILFGLLLATNGGSGPTVAQAVMPTDAPPFSNGWVWQNPLPQGFDLYGVTCPTDQGCYAVGVSGTVVASSPATGGHWQTQSSGTTQNLTNVDCVSAGVCVAVGTGGTIRRTTNAGQSWSPAPITTTANLGVLNCLPDGTCYTYDTNGNLFKSSDSGASWARTYYTSSTPTGLSCPDAANCYLLFGDGFSKTTDGGQTWATTPITYSTNQNNSNPYASVSCPTVNTCYLLNTKANLRDLGQPANNKYQVLKTTDGGQSWSGYFTPTVGAINANDQLFKIVCPTTLICYTVGADSNHIVYVTTDGGVSWTIQNSFNTVFSFPIVADLKCSKTDVHICTVVGSSGMIYKSANDGHNRQYQLDGLGGFLPFDVSCVDTNNCYILSLNDYNADGQHTVTYTLNLGKTTNGGSTWVTASTLTLTNDYLEPLRCPDRFTCYAPSANGPVYKTKDGGQTWITYSTGVTNPLSEISCPATSICYGLLHDYSNKSMNTVFKTANGGSHWSTQVVSPTAYLNTISCPEINTCYTAGPGVFKTTDGGASWTYLTRSVEISNAPPIKSLDCPTSSVCYGLRFDNCPTTARCSNFIKTIDGGANWTFQYYPIGSLYRSNLACPDPLTCYIADNSTGVKRTIDGGTSLISDSFAPSHAQFDVISCPRTCTVVGDAGAIVSNHHPVAQDLANLRVSLPTTARPGETTSFTVQARTVSDTVATAYTGTVRFSSTDLAAGLPSEYTFQPGDAGTHTFTTTFNTTGTQVLSANDTYYSQLIKGSAVTGVAVCLPSVVTQPTDNGNDNCGSLSYALKDAATSTSPVYTITFQGVPTVTVSGPLPVISSTNATTRISLDGGCTNGGPGVTIQGAITGTVGSAAVGGLRLKDRVSLNGLQVVGFSGYGISLEGDNNELSCNRIGPGDGNNLIGLANGGGVRIGRATSPGVTASHNRLGRVGEPSSGNSIAGNLGVGLMVEAGQDNALYYTLIGLSSDGQAVLRNKGGALMVSPGTGLRFGPGNRLQV